MDLEGFGVGGRSASRLKVQTAKEIVEAIPPRIQCKPLYRWVGGKRWLVPFLSPKIHNKLAQTNGRYIEPFLGGGAIALDLGLPSMILSDICEPLIRTLVSVRKNPEAVAWALSTLVSRGTDKDSYLKVRASDPHSVVFYAARFIYLLQYGFNGLWRENLDGQNNVPHGGDRSRSKIPDVEQFKAVAAALKTADLRVADFRETIAKAGAGDVVYADSPYYETYSQYSKGGFTEDDHIALAVSLREADNRGATIVASNIDHERVRELYSWANVKPITERHVVGATDARRGLRNAALISSDEGLLK